MDSLLQNITDIKMHLSQVEEQALQLSAGKKASSAKIRASLMKIKGLSHTGRANATLAMQKIPVKSRSKPALEVPVVELEIAPAVDLEVVVKPVKTAKPRKKKVVVAEESSE
jgi:hypothetical protein